MSIPPAGMDSLAAPDSAATDSLKRVSMFPSPALDSLGRGLRRFPVEGGAGEYALEQPEIQAAAPAYLEDILHTAPGMIVMDSLGRGGMTGMSALGTGFSQVRASLNGMPLVDPLTGGFDTRAIPAGILGSARFSSAGRLSGAFGSAAELTLQSLALKSSPAVSKMGISGGSFQLNRVGGGLQRGLFGRGGLHVDINKIQQEDEDFFFDFQQIQYYTRLEQSVGEKAVLSIDGLYFADTRKSRGSFPRQKRDNTWMQAALTGKLGERNRYRFSLRHSSSQHPSWDESALVFAGGVGDGYSASLERQAAESLILGFSVDEEHDRARELALSSASVRNRLLAGHVEYKSAGDVTVSGSAGCRLSDLTENDAVFSLNVSRPAVSRPGFRFSLTREALTPGLLDLNMPDGDSRTGKPQSGKITQAGMDLVFSSSGGMRLSAGVLFVDVADHRFSTLDPDPYALAAAPPIVDYRAAGFGYAVESPFLMGFSLAVRGRGFFGADDDTPYLPSQSHAAVLSREGEFFKGDLGYTFRAEMRYDSDFRFIPAGQQGSLVLQPGRFSIGGSAAVRIIDLIIFGRLDHLLADYYNGTDPLKLAAPRAVFGISWSFYD